MPRFLHRIVALLLVPLLVADPALAPVPSSTLAAPPSSLSSFQEQALVSRLRWFHSLKDWFTLPNSIFVATRPLLQPADGWLDAVTNSRREPSRFVGWDRYRPKRSLGDRFAHLFFAKKVTPPGGGQDRSKKKKKDKDPSVELVLRTENAKIVPAGVKDSGLQFVRVPTILGGNADVPIWVRQPISAAIQWGLHQDFLRGGPSLAESFSGIFAIEEQQNPTQQHEARQALMRHRSEVVSLHAMDVFAEMRAALGLQDAADVIFDRLVGDASVAEGLAMFQDYFKTTDPGQLKKHGVRRIRTIQDLNKLIPDITAYEVAVVSLLERVPRLFIKRPPGATVMLRDLFIDGAAFMTDVHTARLGDIYQDLLGVTGAREGDEFIYYRIGVRNLIDKLVRLRLSDATLFQKAYEHHEADAIRRGYAWVQQTPAFQAHSQIENLLTGQVYRLPEVIHLIGMLERLPAVLQADAPFVGYVVPYGAGLKFIDLQGKVVDYVAMHSYIQASAYTEIYGLAHEDISPNNPVMSAIARELRRELENRIYESLSEWSILETLAAEALTDFGVFLPIGGRKIPALDATTKQVDWTDVWRPSVHHAASAKYDAPYSLKMSLAELSEVLALFRLFPPQIRTLLFPHRIKRLFKGHRTESDLEDAAELGLRLGDYDGKSQTIRLFDYPEVFGTYLELNPVLRQIHHDTLVHEVGEALYEQLPPAAKEQWRRLSGWTDETTDGSAVWIVHQRHSVSKERLADYFLTTYSQNAENDDFSECLMAYVLHGEEFRRRAESPTASGIAAKYAFFLALFDGQAYIQISQHSMEQTAGQVKEIAKRINFEAAQLLRERATGTIQEALWDRGDASVGSVEAMRDKELGVRRKRVKEKKKAWAAVRVHVVVDPAMSERIIGRRVRDSFKARNLREAIGLLFNRYRMLEKYVVDDAWNLLPGVQLLINQVDLTEFFADRIALLPDDLIEIIWRIVPADPSRSPTTPTKARHLETAA